jgi:hypothetical protein
MYFFKEWANPLAPGIIIGVVARFVKIQVELLYSSLLPFAHVGEEGFFYYFSTNLPWSPRKL